MNRMATGGEPRTSAQKPAMKGIAFVNVKHFVVERFGTLEFGRVMTHLAESDRGELMSAVAVGWYEVEMYGRLLRAVDTVCGQGDLGLAYQIGLDSAERDFGRAIRTLLRIVTPEYAIKSHMRVWRHFQDSGEWSVTRDAPNDISGTLHGYVADEAICTELTGYFDRFFAFTGATNVRTEHVRCRARGGDFCQFRTRFR